ncbi:MAG: hypothetical protein QXU47_04590 [Candidatus Bathyarchaeia archaeon]
MSLVGKCIRLGRIFNKKTGRTVVVIMDHGVDLGPLEDLEDPGEALSRVLSGDFKPDAILMNPSMIRLKGNENSEKIGRITQECEK